MQFGAVETESSPFLGTGAEQAQDSGGRRCPALGAVLSKAPMGLSPPPVDQVGCFLSATALPCADGTAAGDSACMNARVTLQAGGISAARSPAVILPLEPKQHQAPEHLAYRLLEFCLNT